MVGCAPPLYLCKHAWFANSTLAVNGHNSSISQEREVTEAQGQGDGRRGKRTGAA